jgi:hypothetical protein
MLADDLSVTKTEPRDLYYRLSYRIREGPEICYRIAANREPVFVAA